MHKRCVTVESEAELGATVEGIDAGLADGRAALPPVPLLPRMARPALTNGKTGPAVPSLTAAPANSRERAAVLAHKRAAAAALHKSGTSGGKKQSNGSGGNRVWKHYRWSFLALIVISFVGNHTRRMALAVLVGLCMFLPQRKLP